MNMRIISEMKIKYLRRHADRYSKKKLARAVNLSRRQVYRILERLKAEPFKQIIASKKVEENRRLPIRKK